MHVGYVSRRSRRKAGDHFRASAILDFVKESDSKFVSEVIEKHISHGSFEDGREYFQSPLAQDAVDKVCGDFYETISTRNFSPLNKEILGLVEKYVDSMYPTVFSAKFLEPEEVLQRVFTKDTSPGPGWKEAGGRRDNSKKDIFPSLFMEAFNIVYNGGAFQTVASGSLKDEMLPLDKIDNLKTRLFMGMSVVHFAVGSYLFEYQDKELQQCSFPRGVHDHGITYGSGLVGSLFTQMYRTFQQLVNRHYGFGYQDFKWFDKTNHPEISRFIQHLRSRAFPSRQAQMADWYYFQERYLLVIMPNGDVKIVYGFTPSGKLTTATDNSLRLMICIIYAYLEYYHSIYNVYNLEATKELYFWCMGDDSIVAWPRCMSPFDMKTQAMYYKRLGMMPKVEEDCDYTNLIYHSSNFYVYSEHPLIVLPRIDKHKLMSSWIYGRKSNSVTSDIERTRGLIQFAIPYPDIFEMMNGFLASVNQDTYSVDDIVCYYQIVVTHSRHVTHAKQIGRVTNVLFEKDAMPPKGNNNQKKATKLKAAARKSDVSKMKAVPKMRQQQIPSFIDPNTGQAWVNGLGPSGQQYVYDQSYYNATGKPLLLKNPNFGKKPNQNPGKKGGSNTEVVSRATLKEVANAPKTQGVLYKLSQLFPSLVGGARAPEEDAVNTSVMQLEFRTEVTAVKDTTNNVYMLFAEILCLPATFFSVSTSLTEAASFGTKPNATATSALEEKSTLDSRYALMRCVSQEVTFESISPGSRGMWLVGNVDTDFSWANTTYAMYNQYDIFTQAKGTYARCVRVDQYPGDLQWFDPLDTVNELAETPFTKMRAVFCQPFDADDTVPVFSVNIVVNYECIPHAATHSMEDTASVSCSIESAEAAQAALSAVPEVSSEQRSVSARPSALQQSLKKATKIVGSAVDVGMGLGHLLEGDLTQVSTIWSKAKGLWSSIFGDVRKDKLLLPVMLAARHLSGYSAEDWELAKETVPPEFLDVMYRLATFSVKWNKKSVGRKVKFEGAVIEQVFKDGPVEKDYVIPPGSRTRK